MAMFQHRVMSIDRVCFRICQQLGYRWKNRGIGKSRNTEWIGCNFGLR